MATILFPFWDGINKIRRKWSEIDMYDLAFSTAGLLVALDIFPIFEELYALSLGVLGNTIWCIFTSAYSFGHVIGFFLG